MAGRSNIEILAIVLSINSPLTDCLPALFQDPLVRRVEGSELIRHETENKLFYSELPRDRRGRYRDQTGAVRVVSTVLVS